MRWMLCKPVLYFGWCGKVKEETSFDRVFVMWICFCFCLQWLLYRAVGSAAKVAV